MTKKSNGQDGYIGQTHVTWIAEEFPMSDGTSVFIFALPDMPDVTVCATSGAEFTAWLETVVQRSLPPNIVAEMEGRNVTPTTARKAVN